ncbi:hypothetical protein RCC89_19550 [Cytophagaceae bacterium ABcell3]|nr:hypothetical protein RCC89_19550 [Cytophagaceae bacterium ABcell3]
MALEIKILKKFNAINFTLPWKHSNVEGDAWQPIVKEVLEYAFLSKEGSILINNPLESSIYDEIPTEAYQYLEGREDKFWVSKVSKFSKWLLDFIYDEEFNRELMWITTVPYLAKERMQELVNAHAYGGGLPSFKDEVMFCSDGMFLFWFNPCYPIPEIVNKYEELAVKYGCEVIVKEE